MHIAEENFQNRKKKKKKKMHCNRKWKTAMPPNYTHEIVHSSAMYYQHLNVIRKSSKKKLLTIKSVYK